MNTKKLISLLTRFELTSCNDILTNREFTSPCVLSVSPDDKKTSFDIYLKRKVGSKVIANKFCQTTLKCQAPQIQFCHIMHAKLEKHFFCQSSVYFLFIFSYLIFAKKLCINKAYTEEIFFFSFSFRCFHLLQFLYTITNLYSIISVIF